MDKSNHYRQLTEVTHGLSVLYVEDEEISRTIVESKLKVMFKNVILAEDGEEGLRKFRENQVDLILTDNLMPRMNGLDMIMEIRTKDIKTPIILITAFMDTDFLIKAINLGVTQFIAKPVNFDNLYNAIEIAVQRVIIENVMQKSREQELELLRYQEKYHSAQQERAFRKELNIIKNDLHLKRLDFEGSNGVRTEWLFDLYYKPLDILSGDSYSVREIGEGRVLIFLVDAMGKGLSASVTTIVSTSFVNYFVDESRAYGKFSFEDLVNTYLKYIRRELLEDEIVSVTFAYIDFPNEFMDTAIFSMPSIMLQTTDGEVISIAGKNMPVMKFIDPPVIDRHNISNIKKILVYSDGLNESLKGTDSLYQEFLKSDFRDSENKNELLEKFSLKIEKPDDDVTFIFLKKMTAVEKWYKEFIIDTRLEELDKMSAAVEDVLTGVILHDESRTTLINSFVEILMNASSHGNLNIDSKLKNRLIKNGEYEDYLLNVQKDNDRKIRVNVSVCGDNLKEFLVIRVCDEGKGFDAALLHEGFLDASLLNGRGISIAKSFVDEIYYNKAGNEVTLIRQLMRR